MDHTAVGGAGVDDAAAAVRNAYVAADDDDVAGLQVAEAGDPLASSAAGPAAAGHIGLVHAGLVQAPVDESGAVKCVRSLGPPGVGASDLGTRDVEEVPDSEKYYTEKHDTVDKHVEFEINTAEISADELETMGYTISEDRKTASKDVTLAKVTYTFDKLPATLDELKKFSLKSKTEGDYDYGMFAPMAATILALHAYGTDKDEAYKMLEFIYGPNQTFSNFDKQFVQTQFATAANKVLQDCYWRCSTGKRL